MPGVVSTGIEQRSGIRASIQPPRRHAGMVLAGIQRRSRARP